MLKTFILPSIVLALGGISFLLNEPLLLLAATLIGIGKIAIDSYSNIKEGNYSLDYIAFLAMVVGAASGEYLAGAVVALMFTGGEALEAFAEGRAERSLKALLSRIPKTAIVLGNDNTRQEVPLRDIQAGSVIVVRNSELIPLDGTLRSPRATLDESNLTGESMPHTIENGAFIKSGVVNAGETLELVVSGTFATSTYARIVDLVAQATEDRSPFVRLAEKANFPFTATALLLAGGAFLWSGEISRALAVLVVATPCPLIIAAPVAFIGGLSRSARSNIIIKRPVALEELSRATTIFFDKTGTLTLGTPELQAVKTFGNLTEEKALHIAAAIEFHSIHPLARAIVKAHEKKDGHLPEATNVKEVLGEGISGVVDGLTYTLGRAKNAANEPGTITLELRGDREVHAHFVLADEIKADAKQVIKNLTNKGLKVHMITGDKKENAEAYFGDMDIKIHADTSPEEKYAIIDKAKAEGEMTVMIGDGLNDAPALARADVGIVFSGTENSAAIEAAEIVIMGNNVASVEETMTIANRSVRIAEQSVWSGIILSSSAMVIAFFGYIPPVVGALIQEGIDIVVILNAVRAAFGGKAE